MLQSPVTLFILLISGLFIGILLSIELGYRLGLRRWKQTPEKARGVSSTVEGSVFTLMGLLVAFTFYGAGTRFDARRHIVGQEANTIGTSYLRLDLLPAEAQPELREEFRKYTRSRIAVFQNVAEAKTLKQELEKGAALQQAIWRRAVEATKNSGPAIQSLVLSPLNEMIDITTTRTVAALTHPPVAVFIMLALTVVTSAALLGYTSAAHDFRDWVSILIFAFVLSAAVYVILDYEFPRVGLIRVDAVDQVLKETLEQMQ